MTKQLDYSKQRPHKGGAIKYDGEKPRLSLIPLEALMELGHIMTYGANKYDSYNWCKGFEYSKLIDASLRHLLAFAMGEDKDSESGYHHLGHAMACLSMLYSVQKHYPELDNRWDWELGTVKNDIQTENTNKKTKRRTPNIQSNKKTETRRKNKR